MLFAKSIIIVIQYLFSYHQNSFYSVVDHETVTLPQNPVWNQFREVPSCKNAACKVIPS